jgi:ABC-2 type transport system permease protein
VTGAWFACWQLLLRDVRVLLGSPLGVVAGTLWIAVTSLLFWMQLLAYEELEHRVLSTGDESLEASLDFNNLLLASTFAQMPWLLGVVATLLASHGVAYDRAHHTDVLWRLAPISRAHVVLAKWGAQLVVLTAFLLWLLTFAGVVAWFGKAEGGSAVDVPQLLSALLGLWLLGALWMSVATLSSCLVAQPMGAAIITFVSLMCLWLMPSIAGYVPMALRTTVMELAPTLHLDSFLRGVLRIESVATLVAGMMMALAWATARLQWEVD